MELSLVVLILTLRSFNCVEEHETISLSLLKLGKSLTERAQDPENQSREFLADLQAYIGELYDIYEKVSTQDWDVIKEGIKAFEAVNKSGNPLHFKQDLDFRRLKKRYYWSFDDRVLHARDLFNETDILWNKVVDRINYMRF